MLKYTLIILSLFSSSLLKYMSLAQKELNIDIDNICYYLELNDLTNHEDDIEYVKPCESNHYCRIMDSDKVGTCEKYTPIIKKLNEDCSSTNDCDYKLDCIKNKCLVKNNSEAYSIKSDDSLDITLDIYPDIQYYCYCPDYLIPIEDTYPNFKCKPKEEVKMEGMCFKAEDAEGAILEKKAFPEYFKVCGENSLEYNAGTYRIKNTSTNYIGSVDDGKFVEDIRACKSGYALLFYGDGNITKPENENSDGNMFKMCVTINQVEIYDSACYINYTIGQNSYIYNSKRVMASNTYNLFDKCEFIMEKIELFKNYLEKMEEMNETCKSVRYYNEPFTCGNDTLRKLWYFYNNIENYLLYKNEDDVINFLIQNTYHLYGFEDEIKKEENDFILFFNIKYYIFLLLFLITN